MNFGEIKNLVKAEYDTRPLVSNVRYKALEKFDKVLKELEPNFWNDVSKFPVDKTRMKMAYEKILNKKLNGAETSMINEVYNQLVRQNITLTDY